MEIITIEPVMSIAPWTLLAIIIGIPCTLFIIFGVSENIKSMLYVGIILVGCAASVLIFAPRTTPTGKIIYTVEITNESKYKELIEMGYDFERVYPNKDIYKITGDELYL